MNCRPHGRKPTLALWMLVAVADVAIFVAAAGLLTVLLLVAGLVTVAGAVAAVRLLPRRDLPSPQAVAAPVRARRRA